MILPDLEHALEQFCADAHFVASVERLIHDKNRSRSQTEVSNKAHRFGAGDTVDPELCGGAGWTRGNEKVQVAVSSGLPVSDSVACAFASHSGQT